MPEQVRAAGGVLWRTVDGQVELALVHRPKYDDWSLPKGKLERGEPTLVAAAREVGEETGATVRLGRALGVSRYEVEQDGRSVPKTVQWWSMRATGGAFTPTEEVDELRWLPPDDALALLTRQSDAVPVERLLSRPLDTTTLLVVRHGSAGSSDAWEGDDDARPLDRKGERQARAAAQVLPLFGPAHLATAPLERCRATLAPLAEATGLPLEDDPLLSAACFAEDPQQSLERFAQYASCDGAAVCSQGEVVPAAVRWLAARAGVDLGAVPAPKGGLWVLTSSGGRLVAADPVPDLRD